MALQTPRRPTPAFESWIPLARQVVRTSLRLGWKDVFTIYTYPSTIPLAEGLALAARRGPEGNPAGRPRAGPGSSGAEEGPNRFGRGDRLAVRDERHRHEA